MEFDVRQSGAFVFNILLVIVAGFMTVFSLVFFWNTTGFIHYFFILWLIVALARRIHNYFHYFVLAINKKPALTINEVYMSDEANRIKYYWEDIVGLSEENLYLYISVKDPDAYLKNISSPVRRFFVSASGPEFRINLDVIKCDANVLIDLINESNPWKRACWQTIN